MKFPLWVLWAIALALVAWPVVTLYNECGSFGARGLGLGFFVGGTFMSLCYEFRDWRRKPVETPE